MFSRRLKSGLHRLPAQPPHLHGLATARAAENQDERCGGGSALGCGRFVREVVLDRVYEVERADTLRLGLFVLAGILPLIDQDGLQRQRNVLAGPEVAVIGMLTDGL
ncbi:MAG: hypothetical protein JXR84_11350, partial [Anaerolineae bacterium]|nr:hypothetical protein [Anaerolineae bacterium]